MEIGNGPALPAEIKNHPAEERDRPAVVVLAVQRPFPAQVGKKPKPEQPRQNPHELGAKTHGGRVAAVPGKTKRRLHAQPGACRLLSNIRRSYAVFLSWSSFPLPVSVRHRGAG